MDFIKQKLFELQDLNYRDFHSKLMPGIDKETIIGIRVPVLKKLAKEIYKTGEYSVFLSDLPHTYYEENNLHAFIIAQISDYDTCIGEVEKFLPYIDNWATCDGLRPEVFKKNTDKLYEKIKAWLKSDKTFTVRFGLEMLMCHYLDDNFKIEYLDLAASLESEEYYVNMMISWFFATALSKHYDMALPYLSEKKLPVWVHNKTISKCIDSYRITPEQKKHLRSLKY